MCQPDPREFRQSRARVARQIVPAGRISRAEGA